MPNFARRLRDNQSGNVLAMAAGLMPLLMGSAALAIDATQMALWKRQLQRTADSGAIAGAYALTQDGDAATVEASVNNDLDENPHPPIQTLEIFAGAQGGFQQAVRVNIVSRGRLAFAGMFTGGPTTIAADATAAIVQEGNFCMVSLYDGDDTGIVMTGNSTVTLGCGMVTNSTSDDAVQATGSSQITASPIGAVGGLSGSTNNYVGGTSLLPYTAPQSDPLSYLPNPSYNGCPGGDIVVDNGETFTSTSGAVYCSVTVKPGGTLAIAPGPFVVYGGDVDLKGTIRTVAAGGQAEGSTFIMTGPDGAAGEFDSNSQASINIKPPSSGTLNGISFYRDRRAAYAEIKINGGSGSVFTGAYYFPTADLRFNGNASLSPTCLQLVGRKLNFSGNFSLTNTCSPGTGGGNFSRRLVRLVE
jgi:Flp pilus assembly protein TadG